MPKLCEFKNCTRRASYGLYYGKPLRCKTHKENMKPQYSICVCGKSYPNYNYLTESRPKYCNKCKLDEMIDIKHKKCITCKKVRPNYNYPTKTRALYCNNCKLDEMVNVIDKKCITCKKVRPNYNYPTETRALYCNNCKLDEMIDIKNKKCIKCKNITPNYNYPTETRALYCASCKTSNMINVKDKKCISCKIKRPNFNLPGKTKAEYCSACKTLYMVDIKHKKCINCKDWPDYQRGNKKYKGYCARCFQHLFPKDPLSFQIRSKTKEIAVRDYINANFDGFVHDKALYTGHCDCTVRRRIDHRILIDNTLLAIETDENQHKSYDKMNEETRYDDLYMAFSGKWIYIRFNPDKYVDTNGKNKNPAIATRLRVLKNEIEQQIKRIKNCENTDLVERIYLYYDKYT
jgi:hypothetical protein